MLRLHGRETRTLAFAKRLPQQKPLPQEKRTAGGYITEAFDRVLGEIDEVKAQNQAQYEDLKRMISEQNGKIDAILRSITGLGNL